MEYFDRISHQGEVHEAKLEDMVPKIAFEDEAAGPSVDQMGTGGEVRFSSKGIKGQSYEVSNVLLCWCRVCMGG